MTSVQVFSACAPRITSLFGCKHVQVGLVIILLDDSLWILCCLALYAVFLCNANFLGVSSYWESFTFSYAVYPHFWHC